MHQNTDFKYELLTAIGIGIGLFYTGILLCFIIHFLISIFIMFVLDSKNSIPSWLCISFVASSFIVLIGSIYFGRSYYIKAKARSTENGIKG